MATVTISIRKRCMDDLTTGRNFDSQAKWVIDALGLFISHT